MSEGPGIVSGTRRLLRRLRGTMAGYVAAQERLDQIVRIVAGEMIADVCSVYITRAGEVLELFATEGLRPEAVHRTRLRVGEGLVGLIAATAKPLAIADAQSHPGFAYRPETGEETYRSLMGVPILRAGRILGVLVVQNTAARHYDEDEIEVLQTIAMILAELVAGGELVNPREIAESRALSILSVRLDGMRLNPGLALGPAVLHEPQLQIRRYVAEDIPAEIERLQQAVAAMRDAIDQLVAAGDGFGPGDGEHREILETYRMFAADRGWVSRIADAIRSGLTAEAAVQKIREETSRRMMQASDPYLRERLVDLEDLANRLQRHLSDRAPDASLAELPQAFILVARALGPIELMDYSPGRIMGLVLEEGSPTAHVAIVARALDIPVVGRVDAATTRIEADDLIIVDGDHAQILIRPSEDVRQSAAAALVARSRRQALYQGLRCVPAATRDGIGIKLMLNAGLLMDMAYLQSTRADGVGLFRTEFPLMVQDRFPAVDDQTEFYRRVFEQAGDRPVFFRTLDIGGEKLLPYLPHTTEDNPAMGWRAIRIGLDRPAMLREQLRALIRAAAGRQLYIKFPMIAELPEFERARALLDMELARAADERRVMPASVQVGVMLEVPALLWQLPELCRHIDFLSIGTNDLLQFVFACDRSNPRLADRYDPLSAPVLKLLREVVAQTNLSSVPLSMCGEMAGTPLEAMVLIALGFRTLSMSGPAIGPVKSMIRSLDAAAAASYLEEVSHRPEHSLRSKFEAYAHDHLITV
jgi:phosphotransferase system, enzyme I, PtsP